MGSIQDMEAFRRKRAGPTETRGYGKDLSFSHEMEGRCSGCQARRSFFVAHHDTGTEQGTMIFARTLPHFLCDGEKVIEQDDPERLAGQI